MYTAFVTDVFSRRIVGWALFDSMRTEDLPLHAFNQVFTCTKETTSLIHHSVHGSQYVSVVYNERLAEHKIAACTGTVGDCYDNAPAENIAGSCKNELILTERGMMFSTWKFRRSSGLPGGITPGFIDGWATAHQLRLNRSYVRVIRVKY